MRPIDLVAAWLAGALAIFAAPDGLSTLGYLGIAVGVAVAVGVLLALATRIERRRR